MELPPDVELVSDVSVADWVVGALRPWGRAGVPVASIVPDVFQAFARIQHAGGDASEGELPPDQMATLIRVLSGFTSSGDRCWFCVWDGFGWWFKGSHAILSRPDQSGARAAEHERRSDARDRLMRGMPRVEAEGRAYFLFRGPLSAAHALEFDGFPQSPNLWWPNDRAWCVGTDIDLSSTYVGASVACIEELVDVPELDAARVEPDEKVS